MDIVVNTPMVYNLTPKDRARAVYNHCIQRKYPARKFEDIYSKQLIAAFTWSKSPEGHDYWSEKYSKIMNKSTK